MIHILNISNNLTIQTCIYKQPKVIANSLTKAMKVFVQAHLDALRDAIAQNPQVQMQKIDEGWFCLDVEHTMKECHVWDFWTRWQSDISCDLLRKWAVYQSEQTGEYEGIIVSRLLQHLTNNMEILTWLGVNERMDHTPECLKYLLQRWQKVLLQYRQLSLILTLNNSNI
eukprot:TRINITY_DN2172_c0_g1_i3.p1 TRINITY_DN2172_c0_g1~~TRINITY_DN2172_c0_g1_i3.p1  ORF type:complete len:170 (-),score=3.11 TRINITY_DN2172_c0_g1_i3:368-877(-)